MEKNKAEMLRETFINHFDAPEGVTSGEGYPEPCPDDSREDWILAYYEDDKFIVSVFGLSGSDVLQPFYENETRMWWGKPGAPEQVSVDVEQQLR